MIILHRLWLFVIVVFSSCTEESNINSEDPYNLTWDVHILQTVPGQVNLQVFAENAVSYHFYTGDPNMPDPLINESGIFTYRYNVAGSYQIEVRAYGSNGRYLKDTRNIEVDPGEPVDPGDGYTTPLSYENMNLVWNDEFDGTALNTNNWSFEIGTGCPSLCGWGNNELEYYREENTRVEDGLLVIEARKESYEGSAYTSSRIITKDKQEFKYGRIDIRAKLPGGQGIWPALWMLGANQDQVGWPKCGEIDIMEMIGGSGRERTVHGTAHWYDNGWTYNSDSYSLETGDFGDEFHVFSILWDEKEITWRVDDTPYKTFPITHASRDEFQKEFFFIMNVAVGGNWPGLPDESTVFPVRMYVDYIRIFQDKS